MAQQIRPIPYADPTTTTATGQIVRAGVTGAAVTAGWSAVTEGVRVRNGEITRDEAIKTTATNAAIGAGAGAVAQVASSLARSIPLYGLAAIVIGAGALYLASSKKAAEPEVEPEADAKPKARRSKKAAT